MRVRVRLFAIQRELAGTREVPLELAEGATRFDPSGYRAEFVDLIRRAQAITGQR